MMIDNSEFFGSLTQRGVKFFTGVPDSLLANFCEFITVNTNKHSHMITANEGSAVALAIGHYMKSQSPALVYLQNSGLGNTVNPLLSLADEKVYSVPMLLLIGWRGEPGVKDEPQHLKQGAVTEALLDAIDIPYEVMDCNSNFRQILDVAFKSMNEQQRPFAILVKKNTFDKVSKEKVLSEEPLSRDAAINIILDNSNESDAIVCTTGKASRELFEARQSRNQKCDDFLTVGGMGHASSIAMGVKLAGYEGRVICIDGDGAFLMHMGAAASIGTSDIKNFLHIILDNGCHESVGGQATVARSIDFKLLSAGLGYDAYYEVMSRSDINEALIHIGESNELVMLRVIISTDSRSDLGRPTSTPLQNKNMFMRKLVES